MSLDAEQLQIGFVRLLSDSSPMPERRQLHRRGRGGGPRLASKEGAAREERELQTTTDGAEAAYGAYRVSSVAV